MLLAFPLNIQPLFCDCFKLYLLNESANHWRKPMTTQPKIFFFNLNLKELFSNLKRIIFSNPKMKNDF